MALEAAGAWKAAAAPKVEARRSLECIVLFGLCVCGARRVRECGVVEWYASMSCSVCVMLGTATAMAAAAPRRVLLVRGVVDIVVVTSAARAARVCVSLAKTSALLRAATAATAAGLADARARCDTHRCAIRSLTSAGVGARGRFSPRLRSH